MQTNPTYKNPAPQSLYSVLQALKREVLKDVNCAKIGVIQAFNAATQTATVMVAFTRVTSISPGGIRTLSEYPLLLDVPVVFPAGGGFTMTFPIADGDECLVVFNDRQIDNWLSQGAGQPPSVGRIHDLSDGIAIVGVRSNPRALQGVSTSSAQLRSDDGNTYVEVAGGGIVNVKAPGGMTFTTPELTITGTINVENVDGDARPCIITGNIHATGDIVAGDGSSNISLESHVHSGVTGGSGDTGPPV